MNKKQSAAVLSALAVLAFSSCNKEPQTAPTEEHLYVNACAPTKTILVDSTSILWCPEDEISVFYGKFDLGKFTSLSEDTSSFTVFASEKTFAYGSIAGGTDAFKYIGVYPHSSVIGYQNGGVVADVPIAQFAQTGSFGADAFLSAAVSSDLNLAFYNICGGVMFDVEHEGVTEIYFKANGGEKIAGNITIKENAGNEPPFTVVSSEDIQDEVVLVCEDGFEPGKAYAFALLPCTLSQGYTMTFVAGDDEAVKSDSTSRSIVRSVFGAMGTADKGLTYGEDGGDDTPVTTTATLTYEEAKNYVDGYGSPKEYKNDFGTWTICAYKSDGFQINSGKVAYIGTPTFGGAISSITIETKSSYTNDFYFCSSCGDKNASDILQTSEGQGTTSTFDLSKLSAKQIYIRSEKAVQIKKLTLTFSGSGSGGQDSTLVKSAFTEVTAYGVYSDTDEEPTAVVGYRASEDQLTYGTSSSTHAFGIMNFSSSGYFCTVSVNASTFAVGSTYSAVVSVNGTSTTYNSIKCVSKQGNTVWLEDETTHNGIILPIE